MAEEAPKKKRNRKKGGYALVEVKEGSEGVGRVLDILVSDMDSQDQGKKELKRMIEEKEIEADGTRNFGIIQVKTLSLCPNVETKVTVTW